MQMKSTLYVSILLALSGCVSANTTTIPGRSLTADYTVDGIRWTSGETLMVVTKVYEQNGKVSLCGAHATDKRNGIGGQTFHDLALRSMSVSIDDQLLVTDLSYLNSVPYPTTGRRPFGSASCVLTEVPWKSTYGNSKRPVVKANRTGFTIRN